MLEHQEMLKTTKKIMLAMLTRLGGHGHLGGLSKCGSREQMVKASFRDCGKTRTKYDKKANINY